ncbi:FAD-binding oxidoreductase [Rhodobacter sp. KR11]|uniref:NAD(P)/FAD-dependent oxidoreductase n=1 Tax=Rhodobacter sp. KR11 TaxID=2974588 RepID=UPI002221E20F|nr:FAD-dependent oxidoreductase [Rhodobacter sp. KR11]MCW1917620.1 FAD-binding oxidoreductase [Rhodobacter sp. KR11]
MSPAAKGGAPTSPATWYSETRLDRAERPALKGAHDTDTVIIGGGLAGLTTALELARHGTRVTVIEAQSLGFGASGRNGGIVSASYACGASAIRARAGAAGAEQLHALSVEGVTRLRQTIAEFAIKGAEPTPGLLHLRRFDQGADLRAEAEALATQGLPVTYLDAEAIADRLETRRYHHGIEDRQAFHIHPLNYVLGLARAAESLGVRIYENTPAVATDFGISQRIRTPKGMVTARRIVLATGGYTGALIPRLQRAILPIATYMMATEAAPDLLAEVIRTPMAVLDDRRASDYYRVSQGRLLWGGRITTRAAPDAAVARDLHRAMVEVYPQLAGLRVDHSWSGLMGYARHRMPQLGRLAPDLWHITAFGGHGLNTTAIAGKVLAEAMLGQSDRIKAFAPFGLDWAGGRLGLIAAQLTYWGLQAQDKWRERRSQV